MRVTHTSHLAGPTKIMEKILHVLQQSRGAWGAWSIFPPRKKRFPTRQAILSEARSCTPRAARGMKIHSANEVPCSDAILSEPHIAMCAKSGGSRKILNSFGGQRHLRGRGT